jgi:hypothetical protein
VQSSSAYLPDRIPEAQRADYEPKIPESLLFNAKNHSTGQIGFGTYLIFNQFPNSCQVNPEVAFEHERIWWKIGVRSISCGQLHVKVVAKIQD